MENLKKKIVEYSALIHDGILAHKDFMSKFDLKDLSAHVREETKTQCSIAAKLQEIDKDALGYKTLIETWRKDNKISIETTLPLLFMN